MLIYKIQAFLIVLFLSISFLGCICLAYDAYLGDEVNVVCSGEVSRKDCDEYKETIRNLDR
jgi:hypothetical protein